MRLITITVKAIFTLAAAAHGSPGDCEDMMMQAFSNVNSAVRSSWMSDRGLHNRVFYDNHSFDDEQYSGRLSKFEHNMRRWGKRFDGFSCRCRPQATATIPEINSIADIDGFLTYMNLAGSDMFCGKEHHMQRKMKHAKQIMRV